MFSNEAIVQMQLKQHSFIRFFGQILGLSNRMNAPGSFWYFGDSLQHYSEVHIFIVSLYKHFTSQVNLQDTIQLNDCLTSHHMNSVQTNQDN